MRGGEGRCDHADVRQQPPAPQGASPGSRTNQIPGYYFEHLEFREGKGSSNPAAPGSPGCGRPSPSASTAHRSSRRLYGDLAGNTAPMNSMIYYSTQAAYKPVLLSVQLQPVEGARHPEEALLGWGLRLPAPAAPGPVSGLPAKFRWTWTASNAVRTNTEAIVKGRDEADRHRHRRGSAGGERRLRDRTGIPGRVTSTSPSSPRSPMGDPGNLVRRSGAAAVRATTPATAARRPRTSCRRATPS